MLSFKIQTVEREYKHTFANSLPPNSFLAGGMLSQRQQQRLQWRRRRHIQADEKTSERKKFPEIWCFIKVKLHCLFLFYRDADVDSIWRWRCVHTRVDVFDFDGSSFAGSCIKHGRAPNTGTRMKKIIINFIKIRKLVIFFRSSFLFPQFVRADAAMTHRLQGRTKQRTGKKEY